MMMIKSRRRRTRRRAAESSLFSFLLLTLLAACSSSTTSFVAVVGAISFLRIGSTSSNTGGAAGCRNGGGDHCRGGQSRPFQKQQQQFHSSSSNAMMNEREGGDVRITSSGSGISGSDIRGGATSVNSSNSSGNRILGILPPFPRFRFWPAAIRSPSAATTTATTTTFTTATSRRIDTSIPKVVASSFAHPSREPFSSSSGRRVLGAATRATTPLPSEGPLLIRRLTRRRNNNKATAAALFQSTVSVETNNNTTISSSHSALGDSLAASSEKTSSPSVHLRLNDNKHEKEKSSPPNNNKQNNNNDDNNNEDEDASSPPSSSQKSSSSSPSVVKVHSYTDPSTQKTWKALNTAKSKFLAFLQYNNVTTATIKSIVTQETNILVDPSRQQQEQEEKETTTTMTTTTARPPLSFMGKTLPSAVTASAVAAKAKKDEADSKSALRKEWRDLWKRRQLLTDRTEFLAVYPSDSLSNKNNNDNNKSSSSKSAATGATAPRRGGFVDLLHLYTERMAAILRDEREDVEYCQLQLLQAQQEQQQLQQLENYTTSTATTATITAPSAVASSTTTTTTTTMEQQQRSLVVWLQENFGREATQRLQADQLHQYPVDEQLRYWKQFLEWFRSEFPYYYDRCGSCGASIKEDTANNSHESNSNNNSADSSSSDDDCTHHHEDEEEEGQGYQTFVGYVFPGQSELDGKASRTELYRCHKCNQFTRFPRFNSVWHVIKDRRGRCGEYSMLLFRFLRALGHECRWVVDWADHVWAEVYVPSATTPTTITSSFTKPAGRWIHLDPCEAAVDENLIYQGWGKKQTYILGFYAPPKKDDSISTHDMTTHSTTDAPWTLPFSSMTRTSTTLAAAPLIQDITSSYTSDTWREIYKRRDESESEVRNAIQKSIGNLRTKIRSAMTVSSPPSLSNDHDNGNPTAATGTFSTFLTPASTTTTTEK